MLTYALGGWRALIEPTGDAHAALVRLARALERPSPWPDFSPANWPVVVHVPGSGAFCRGHPDPGPAEAVAPGPWGRDVVRLLEVPSGAGQRLLGLPTAFLEFGPHLETDLWLATFRLHLRHRLHREPPDASPDPAGDAGQLALYQLEALVRAEALAAPAAELAERVRTLCLVRRERRAPLEDGELAREQAAEAWEGLPAYVAGVASPPGRWGRSGAELALLLDRWAPDWQRRWSAAASATLDGLLEERVSFDGGEGDEALLQAAQARHAYPELLAAARETVAASRRAREELITRILRGEGSLLVVDVSALGEGFVEAAEPGQRVNAGLAVYRGEVAFRYRGAEVFFHDLPVAEDRRAGLLQARIRGRLRVTGDGREVVGEAAFAERLDMELPGMSLRARRGWVRPLDDGLYVKLEPAG
jgi:hypothetical protein